MNTDTTINDEKDLNLPNIDKINQNYFNYGKPSAYIRIEDGWLISFDAGEYGGSVFWLGIDGETYYAIHPISQVNHIFKLPDGIYATKGMANMGANYGGILKLELDTQKIWVARHIVDLPAKPKDILKIESNGTIHLNLYWDSSNVIIRPDFTFTHKSKKKESRELWWVLVIIALGLIGIIRLYTK